MVNPVVPKLMLLLGFLGFPWVGHKANFFYIKFLVILRANPFSQKFRAPVTLGIIAEEVKGWVTALTAVIIILLFSEAARYLPGVFLPVAAGCEPDFWGISVRHADTKPTQEFYPGSSCETGSSTAHRQIFRWVQVRKGQKSNKSDRCCKHAFACHLTSLK